MLILLILVGVFGLGGEAEAQDDPHNVRVIPVSAVNANDLTPAQKTQYDALTPEQEDVYNSAIGQNMGIDAALAKAKSTVSRIAKNDESALSKSLDQCGSIGSGSVAGCLQRLIYIIFVTIPSFLLAIAAKMFDFLAGLTLSSNVYKYTFIQDMWVIIRDFSNIFFILILLYIAIQTILGLGHETKKMIVNVVILALLVNFSLFFTRVVIDASNITALIFYNKIDTTNSEEKKTSDVNLTGVKEKNLAGQLIGAFNINNFFNPALINNLKLERSRGLGTLGTIGLITGVTVCIFFSGGTCAIPLVAGGAAAVTGLAHATLDPNSATLLTSMMVAYGLVIYSLAYAFFVVALSFLGRMLMLIMLMIFSPFAFVSYTLPSLKKIEKIGFDSWLHSLLSSSFMAAIFMFILYIISNIMNANIFYGFADKNNQELMSIVILIFIPAILITMLLLAGAKYAKKASGEFSEKIVGFGKVALGLAGGLAIGGGIGLAAKGLQGTVGHLGKMAAESEGAAKWATSKDTGLKGWGKRLAGKRFMEAGGAASKSSFDVRRGALGGVTGLLGKATGMRLDTNIVSVEAGGYEADTKKRDAKRKERAEQLKKAASSGAKEELRDEEMESQKVIEQNSHDVAKKDAQITSAKNKRDNLKSVADSTKDTPEYEANQQAYREAAKEVADREKEKKEIKSGREILDEDGNGTGKYRTNNGKISEEIVSAANDEARNAADAVVKAEAKLASATTANTNALNAAATARTANTNAGFDRMKAESASFADPINIPLANTLTAAIEKEKAANVDAKKAADDAVKVAAAIVTATTERDEANTRATAANTDLSEKATLALAGTGNSQNAYEDRILPDAKHKVRHEEQKMARRYSENILENPNLLGNMLSPWRAGERKRSAHDIRMEVKEESHPEKGGKGGGDLFKHVFAAGIADAVVGGGRPNPTPAAKDEHST